MSNWPTCTTCGGPIPQSRHDSYPRWQARKFCSVPCANRAKCRPFVPETKTCEFCGGTATRRRGESPKQWSKRRFCSAPCTARALASSENSHREIPVEPLRDAVLQLKQEEGASWCELARRCGWLKKGTSFGDSSPIKRQLGLKDDVDVHRGVVSRRRRATMTYESAVRLVDKLGLDPVDCGV